MYGRVSFYWVLPISRCIIPLIKRRERIRDSAKSTTKIPSYHTQKRYSIGQNVSRIYHTHSHAHSQDLCSNSFTKFLQQYINYQSKYEMKWNTMKKICAFHFNLSRCLSSLCVLFITFSLLFPCRPSIIFRVLHTFFLWARGCIELSARQQLHIEYTSICKCIRNWNESVPSFIALYTENTHVNSTLLYTKHTRNKIKRSVNLFDTPRFLFHSFFFFSRFITLCCCCCYCCCCVIERFAFSSKMNAIRIRHTLFVCVRIFLRK